MCSVTIIIPPTKVVATIRSCAACCTTVVDTPVETILAIANKIPFPDKISCIPIFVQVEAPLGIVGMG